MTKCKEAKYCVLRDSQYIKDIIKFKMKEFNLNITKLAALTGIAGYRIGRYLSHSHYDSLPSITQYQLTVLAEFLGLEIDVTAKVKYSKPKHLR